MLRRAALGLAASAALACGRVSESPAGARNLVLVTIDTLRADRVGAYGSRDVATPHLDALAREGAFFPEAAVAVPLTRPSHATILTGLDPFAHGLRDNVSPPLDSKIPTLATILKDAGFETAGFVSAVVLTVRRDDDGILVDAQLAGDVDPRHVGEVTFAAAAAVAPSSLDPP